VCQVATTQSANTTSHNNSNIRKWSLASHFGKVILLAFRCVRLLHKVLLNIKHQIQNVKGITTTFKSKEEEIASPKVLQITGERNVRHVILSVPYQ
jgi:hypothetical protein